MTKDQALKKIKQLRDKVSDSPDQEKWQHDVLVHLDKASDVLEFPNNTTKSHLANTIRLIVPNLRHRWPTELDKFSDMAIARAYEDFSMSNDFGCNDEKFPEWFEAIADYMDKL